MCRGTSFCRILLSSSITHLHQTQPMRLTAGMKLAHYQILAPLGAGGMGEVYRARDVRLDRDVAVKVLPERLADAAEALARFEREAKALAALSHANLVAIFDVGREQGI